MALNSNQRNPEVYKVRWICGTAGEFQSEVQMKLRKMGKLFALLDTVFVNKEEVPFCEDNEVLFEIKIYVPGGLSSSEMESLRIHFGDIKPSETMKPDYPEAV